MIKLDNTAERTALWRALHVQIDAQPYIFEDNWALTLSNPAPDWQQRPDMKFTRPIRASIVGRARFVEDQIMEAIENGITQYVILGAGLDSFALRHPNVENLDIYEIDQPSTLAWKADRINAHLDALPAHLHFVPVDFETTDWWDALGDAGFDFSRPAVFSCTGVTLYLSQEANFQLLARISSLAAGSAAIISFYAHPEDLTGEDKALLEMSIKGAAASGTPMVSFFNQAEVKEFAEKAGLSHQTIYDTDDLINRYFKSRKDDLMPNAGELFLVATVSSE